MLSKDMENIFLKRTQIEFLALKTMYKMKHTIDGNIRVATAEEKINELEDIAKNKKLSKSTSTRLYLY